MTIDSTNARLYAPVGGVVLSGVVDFRAVRAGRCSEPLRIQKNQAARGMRLKYFLQTFWRWGSYGPSARTSLALQDDKFLLGMRSLRSLDSRRRLSPHKI